MCYKVLLVDDDVSLTSSIALYLLNEGFNVKVSNDVSKALILLKNFLPDIVISDIVMPKQNGYDLLELMQDNSEMAKIPVIFLTAKGMTQDRIRGYDMGCYGYLTKPFDPAELLSIIKNILIHVSNSKIKKVTYQQFNQDNYTGYINGSINFTEREKTVLKYVLQGMTNKEIANKLNLTVRNVEKYVSRLLSKTGTRNRTHLSQYFYRITKSINQGE
uniref:TctD transcriptional regulator n=1 Tax=Dichotomaria marginata TaxID=268567 RepID=A0A1G4NSJ9_9FLOR|nr:Hypothetical protein ycf29 [Dichotomaria marginata]SCW21643.1 Hypothetical protein ycf29 [Dichotomaria marginata]